ncbi:MAG: hypothetical protein AAGI38_24535 [Bacteroidota bacterium]
MKHSIIYIGLCLLLGSCAIYTPQVAPPVLVEDKGDLQADIGGNISSFLIAPGLNGSIAYGFTDRIQAQAYASYISSGTTHLQVMTGYKVNIDPRTNLKVFGGYFYGRGDVQYGSLFSRSRPRYVGTYQSLFGKIQLLRKRKIPNNTWGLSLTFGYFSPDYSVSYTREEPPGLQTVAERVTQNGLLLEPYLFYRHSFSGGFGVTVSYANCWIKPLDQLDNEYPNRYALDYNYFGNFGCSIDYLIKSGSGKARK